MLGGRSTSDLQVWDMEQNKQMKSIDIKAERLDHGKVAFSPNGDYFVAVEENKLTLFKASDGKVAGGDVVPRNMSGQLAQPAESKNGDPEPARRRRTSCRKR